HGADGRSGLLGGAHRRVDPAEKGRPDPARHAAQEQLEDAGGDHQVGEDAPYPDGVVDAALPASRPPPQERAQQPTAVERKRRYQVEEPEQHVDEGEPGEKGGQEDDAGRKTRERIDEADQEWSVEMVTR